MCIICRKQPKVKLDEESWGWLENSFDGNDDGAGFMYRADGKVRIFKGYMTWESFRDAVLDKLDIINKQEVIFHFRIGTSGTTSKAMCHPFPISKKDSTLGQTKLKTNAALVHNGIIPGYGDKEFSDTHVFVRDVLTELPYKTKAMRQLMASALHSKFMIMDADTTYLMGDFQKEEGWEFSNGSYKYKPRPYTYSGGVTSAYGGKDYEYSWHHGYSKTEETVNSLLTNKDIDPLDLPILDPLTGVYIYPVECHFCGEPVLPDDLVVREDFKDEEDKPVSMCDLCYEFYQDVGPEAYAHDLEEIYPTVTGEK